MNVKERWLAAIGMDPVDRLPFWPKLPASYLRAQEAPFCSMSVDDMHHYFGSDAHVRLPSCIQEVRQGSGKTEETRGGTRVVTFHAGSGSVEGSETYDPVSGTWHPTIYPIRDVAGIRIMTEWFSDCQVELDESGLDAANALCERTGMGAVTASTIGRSPLMYTMEFLAGMENTHYFLMDYREEMEGLFTVLHGLNLRKTEIIARNSPADLLYFTEDTSTTLISPGQFRTYCLPCLQTYGKIINSRGRVFVLHMCGHLKALLPDLAGLNAAAFEAFTSPPVGNTTLVDGRTVCPDKCLIGGTNADLWTKSPGEIIERLKEDLDALPHHRGLVISSAGLMPPVCKPETIEEVCSWVKAYEIRV